MPKIHLKIFSTALLLAFVFMTVFPTTQARASNDSSTAPGTHIHNSYFGLPTIVVMGVTAIGHWLTPIDEWKAEIRKLTDDELFVQRWMLLNDDPESLEKGKRALARIQKEKKAKQKKLRRLERWAYPVIALVGSGAMALTLWLKGK